MSKKIVFVLVLLAAVIPVQANALWNGGFEQPTALEGWWTYLPDTANESIVVQSSNVYEGSNAIEIWTASDPSAELGQDVTWGIAPGGQIKLSLEYRGSNWGGAGVSLNCWNGETWLSYAYAPLYAGNGEDTGWQTFNTDLLINSGWPAYVGSYEGTLVIPAETTIVKLKIVQWGWAITDIDNVNMTVPEPATMIMLSIGGLALIRRKVA